MKLVAAPALLFVITSGAVNLRFRDAAAKVSDAPPHPTRTRRVA
jgi:hypothetical protein